MTDTEALPEAPSTSGSVVSADGTVLAYRTLGTGAPLVICHGAFATSDDWIAVANALAATRTVYLYDRRGHGGSPTVSPDFAVDAEVDDLAAIVRLAGPDTAILGHSLGGGCALACAAREGLTGAVVVYEPRHSIVGPASGGHIPYVRELLAAGDLDGSVRAVLETVLGLPPFVVAEFAGSPLWARMLETVEAFPDELRFLDSLTWQPGDLAGFTGPSWELIGELTPDLPADHEGVLGSVVPGIRRVTVPGQSHFAYLSDPALLARIVGECLDASATTRDPSLSTAG